MRYTWHESESQPGLYKRGLYGMEAAIAPIAEETDAIWSMFTSITVQVSLDTTTFLEKIQRAWIALRHRHPMIAARIDAREMSYCVQSPQEVETWCKETVHAIQPANREGMYEAAFQRRHLLLPQGEYHSLHLLVAQDITDTCAWHLLLLGAHQLTDVRGSLGVSAEQSVHSSG